MHEGISPSRLAEDFPFLRKVAYLDTAAVCPPPRKTVEVMTRFYTDWPLNYGVGISALAKELAAAIDDGRAELAAFVGAGPNEIAFAKNTTEAINVVARGLAWQPGDEIIVSDLEHQSNLIPWFRLAKSNGVKVHVTPHGQDGLVSPESVAARLSRRTRLVALTHVSNVLGTIQPVAKIVELARSAGALTLVDAAQSAGRVPLNVAELGVDFVAFCGRKALMGPQGTAFLYVRPNAVEKLEVLVIGSRAATIVGDLSYQEAAAPFRFEAGVLNTAGVLGLATSAAYLKALGMEWVAERVRKTARLLHDELSRMKIKVHSPWSENQAGIISWSMAGIAAGDVARRLDQLDNIIVGSGYLGSSLAVRPMNEDGIVRTSVHWFTSEDDINRLLKAIAQIRKAVG